MTLLCAVVSVAWGAVTTTYTFTDREWNSTCNNEEAKWEGDRASGFTENQGVQLYGGTKLDITSPKGFSNISKIEIKYCTNSKKGKGSITIKVGNNNGKSYQVTAPSSGGGNSLKTQSFTYSPVESGSVKISVDISENSVYIYSIAITEADNTPSISVSPTTINAGYEGVTNGSFNYSSNNVTVGNIVYYEDAEGANESENQQISWFHPTISNGKVTYNIDENNSNERTLYFKVKGMVNGTQNYVYSDLVTVTQDGNPATITTLWEEDFSGENVLSKYTITNGETTTKIYNESSAGGESPELLISNNGGSMAANISLYGYSGYLTLSFKSNHPDYLTVSCSNGGEVTSSPANNVYYIKVAEGTTTIILTIKNNESSNARIDDICLVKGKTVIQGDAGLSYSESSFTAKIGETNEFPILNNPHELEINYSSSNTNVATIDANGNITLKAAGETTITATSAETDEYFAGEASYTLTVKKSGSVVYRKVTSTDEITDGNYLIVYEGDATHSSVAFDGSKSVLDATNNGVPVTITNDQIETAEEIYFTINTANGTIRSASDNYIGATTYSNRLDQNTSSNFKYSTNTFKIENGSAVISIVIPGDKGGTLTMRYNYASDQLRFRYFRSGQQPIQLYKEVEPFTLTVSSAATDGTSFYATMSAIGEGNFKVPKGVEASTIYIDEKTKKIVKSATFIGDNNAILPGNEAYLIEATTAGEKEFIPTTASATQSIGTNWLYPATKDVLVTAPTGEDENDKYFFYQLSRNAALEDNSVGFYWGKNCANGVPFSFNSDHKAYLAVPKTMFPDIQSASAITFDDNTDGINGISASERGERGVYTLTGVRVDSKNLPKGIYIVDGKKQVVK